MLLVHIRIALLLHLPLALPVRASGVEDDEAHFSQTRQLQLKAFEERREVCVQKITPVSSHRCIALQGKTKRPGGNAFRH